VEDLCLAAGFTRGAFYSNFSSQEELFLALWDREARRIVGGVRALVQIVESGQVGLPEILDSFDALTPRQWFQLNTEFLLHALRSADAARALARHRERLRSELATLITALLAHDGRRMRAGLEVRDLTRMVIAAHEGVQHQSLVEPRRTAGLEASMLGALLEGCTERT